LWDQSEPPTQSSAEKAWAHLLTDEAGRFKIQLSSVPHLTRAVFRALAPEPTATPTAQAFLTSLGLSVGTVSGAIKWLEERDLLWHAEGNILRLPANRANPKGTAARWGAVGEPGEIQQHPLPAGSLEEDAIQVLPPALADGFEPWDAVDCQRRAAADLVYVHSFDKHHFASPNSTIKMIAASPGRARQKTYFY